LSNKQYDTSKPSNEIPYLPTSIYFLILYKAHPILKRIIFFLIYRNLYLHELEATSSLKNYPLCFLSKMHSIKDIIRLIITLTRLTKHFNLRSAYCLFLCYYVLLELDELLKVQLNLRCIPDEIFSFFIKKHLKYNNSIKDKNLYAFCNYDATDKPKSWYYLSSKKSRKKYKILVVFTNDILKNHIYVSESMKFNINKRLNIENSNDSSYFLSKFLH
jgi:hypothetical protein